MSSVDEIVANYKNDDTKFWHNVRELSTLLIISFTSVISLNVYIGLHNNRINILSIINYVLHVINIIAYHRLYHHPNIFKSIFNCTHQLLEDNVNSLSFIFEYSFVIRTIIIVNAILNLINMQFVWFFIYMVSMFGIEKITNDVCSYLESMLSEQSRFNRLSKLTDSNIKEYIGNNFNEYLNRKR